MTVEVTEKSRGIYPLSVELCLDADLSLLTDSWYTQILQQ